MPELQREPMLSRPIRILVVAAHPDDIEYGTAGSVARWIDQGADVTYCIVTDGGAGSDDPNITRAALAELRSREQLAAAATVGVRDVCFLGYPDGILEPTLDLRRDLARLIRQVRPHRVVCSDPTLIFAGNGYINHPDHRAAAEATIYAVFPSAATRLIFPELAAEGYAPHRVSELYMTFSAEPTLYAETTDAIERKLAALGCHASQLGQDELARVREWDAEAGRQCGVPYAETFRVMRFSRDGEEETS